MFTSTAPKLCLHQMTLLVEFEWGRSNTRNYCSPTKISQTQMSNDWRKSWLFLGTRGWGQGTCSRDNEALCKPHKHTIHNTRTRARALSHKHIYTHIHAKQTDFALRFYPPQVGVMGREKERKVFSSIFNVVSVDLDPIQTLWCVVLWAWTPQGSPPPGLQHQTSIFSSRHGSICHQCELCGVQQLQQPTGRTSMFSEGVFDET